MTARHGNWMLTYTGRQYWPCDPRPEEVDIEDIAHALSNLCRYGGHARRFYSVAEHCVLMSLLVPKEHALMALMHGATEAYVCDVPYPLKPVIPGYQELEDLSWKAIVARFDLSPEIPDQVREMDRKICLAEMGYLMKAQGLDLGIPGPMPEVRIRCWVPAEAKSQFLMRFRALNAVRDTRRAA